MTTTGGDVRHPQVFLVVTGHLVRKYGLACCVLDLVGKDGVPACSDGRHMPSYMREAGGLTKACRVVA